MSSKSCFTAAFATVLVVAAVGCDSDPTDPGTDPITIAGDYAYTYQFTSADHEVTCTGSGVVHFQEQAGSTYVGETEEDGIVECTGFEVPVSSPSGVVEVMAEVSNDAIAIQFPLLENQPCDGTGTIENDPAQSLEGDATCTVDPAALELEGDPIELTGPWQAERIGG